MTHFSGMNAEDARAFAEKWLPAWSGNQPERLTAFYSHDAFYSDPAIPAGVRGGEALLAYFRKLLGKNHDWIWTHRGSTPIQDGFLNHWHASIPTGERVIETDGVCTVQLRDGLIYSNQVFFDRSELLRFAAPRLGFDHVAIPTDRPEELITFYRALGFSTPDVTEWRSSGVPFFSIQLGEQKINVHAPELWKRADFTLRGPQARPGCADLCFVWRGDLDSLRATLDKADAEIVAGPVELMGGRGRGTSLYTRDPDSNLLEFIVYAR